MKIKLKNTLKMSMDNNVKVAILSDLHLGVGDNADSSLHNHKLLFEALKHYWEENYIVVLLGDIFEMAENSNIQEIMSQHDDIMWLLQEIHKKGNLIYITGNHDMFVSSRHLKKRFDHYTMKFIDFLDIQPYDSLKIDNYLFIHGHQYTWKYKPFFNKIINFLLRWGWRNLEFACFKDPTSEAIGKRNPSKVDQRYSDYAINNNLFLFAGHTHSVCFTLPNYLNIGGGVLPRCLTCGEIVNNQVLSMKWSVEVTDNNYLTIKKTMLNHRPGI